MIQVLTTTGARHEAFALCQHYMRRQTYAGPVTWIIVDDGPRPQAVERMPDNWLQVVIRRAPYWQPGQNTQAANLLRGLDAIDVAVPLVIVEDDDWYAPDWLDTVTRELECAELVGECRSKYYNAALRIGRQMNNSNHASLCATALRGAAIRTLRQACERRPDYIDMELWQRHRSRHLFDGNGVIGIKGLPGRGGIGMGHRQTFSGTFDPDHALLRQWIGEDSARYACFSS